MRNPQNSYNSIYEDDSLIIINKPAGLLTIGDRYDRNAPNLRAILDEKYQHIFVVHRLDRDTSGIMVFAKNPAVHKILNEQFANLEVEKKYHVVCDGVIFKDNVEINIPLMPDPRKPGRTIPSARGKESLSILNVIDRYRHSTFAEIDLITGRHHQIRAHLAAIGHPLLVDEIYGKASEFKLSQIKKRFNLKKNEVERPIISRITMHAYSLQFIHPISGEKIIFEAEYPKDFKALIEVLNKYGMKR